jgi:hypothetical protein
MAGTSHLYVFLDEGGNFDFSANGTKYVTLTTVSQRRPSLWFPELADLRYDYLEAGLDIERFHAGEDRQLVRDAVFELIGRHLGSVRIDSVVVEKRKTGPALQPIEAFYPRMLGYLLRYVLAGEMKKGNNQVVVITDTLPYKKKRESIRKAIQQTLATMAPEEVTYRIFHHTSQSCIGLQVVDYCNWAIYRKWAENDRRSYAKISSAIASEFDIFRTGTRHYY